MFVTVSSSRRAARAGSASPSSCLPSPAPPLLGRHARRWPAQSGFDQLLVTLGGAGRRRCANAVDLSGVEVVDNPDFGDGLRLVDQPRAERASIPRADGIVLLLGDQPGVPGRDGRRADRRCAAPSPIGVCRYDDGLGHPFWFGRDVFAELHALHGDKAVWKLLRRRARFAVLEVRVGTGRCRSTSTPGTTTRRCCAGGGAMTHAFADADDVRRRLDAIDYLVDEGMATALFLAADASGQPLLLEGEPGVGKTAAAKALARGARTRR